MRILAISGSLRSRSSNTALLRAAGRLAPADVVLTLHSGLANLPYFNSDLDGDAPPAEVAGFRAEVRTADAIVISSPEYAHGVPGVLKNALDWLVGSTDIIGKPVALINASSRATLAHASLADTLSTIGARIVPEASITVPLTGRKLDEDGMVIDPETSEALREAIGALAEAAARPEDSHA